jgi:hypothetical protein
LYICRLGEKKEMRTSNKNKNLQLSQLPSLLLTNGPEIPPQVAGFTLHSLPSFSLAIWLRQRAARATSNRHSRFGDNDGRVNKKVR